MQRDTDRQFDVIVIGSGIGGLTAALTCARAGRSVLVLEAKKQFGGYSNPFARRHFHFDPGIHYINECGPDGSFTRLLRALDLEHVRFVEMDPDGIDNYVFPDYQVKSCVGLDRYRDRLAADFPRERDALHRFFGFVHRFERALKAAERPAGPRDLFTIARGVPGIIRWGRATLAECLDHFFSDPMLKAALSGPCGDLGLPPSRISALMHLGVVTHYAGGAWVPAGGSGALRDAFVDALKEEDAVLMRNTPVAAILHRGGRAHGVRTESGETYRASAIVSNAQADATYRMVGLDHLKPRLRRKVEGLEHSYGSITVYLGVDGELDTSRVGRMNVWSYHENNTEAMYADDVLNGRSESGSYFLSVPTNKDPHGGLAPDGHQTVEIVSLVSPEPFRRWFHDKTMKRGAEYEALKNEIGGRYIEQAEKYLPGLREHTILGEIGTPATNISFASTPDGNIYGPAHTPDLVGPLRFGTKTPIDGLLLAGASVIGAGVIPSASSGRVAGVQALRELDEQRGKSRSWMGRAATPKVTAAARTEINPAVDPPRRAAH